MRKDLRWDGAEEFGTLNTRVAADLVGEGDLVELSNYDYQELGALRKINGNNLQTELTPGGFLQNTAEYTYDTAGTYSIDLGANVFNVTIDDLILIGGGGGGGGGARRSEYGYSCGGAGGGAGYRSQQTNIPIGSQSNFTVVVGAGGAGGNGRHGSSYGPGTAGSDGEDSSIAYGATTISENGGEGGDACPYTIGLIAYGGAGENSGSNGYYDCYDGITPDEDGKGKGGDGGAGIAPQYGSAGTAGSGYTGYKGAGGLYAGGGGGGTGYSDYGYDGGAGGAGYVYVKFTYYTPV